MFGIYDPIIKFNNAFRAMSKDEIDIYQTHPINKLDIAQGVIHVGVDEEEKSCYDHVVATGHTCVNPYCLECK
jgi:hypothetical protein